MVMSTKMRLSRNFGDSFLLASTVIVFVITPSIRAPKSEEGDPGGVPERRPLFSICGQIEKVGGQVEGGERQVYRDTDGREPVR
jgi:hypothetical protein